MMSEIIWRPVIDRTLYFNANVQFISQSCMVANNACLYIQQVLYFDFVVDKYSYIKYF